MENLTKENFFNEVEENHPTIFAVFKNWIDDYKNEVNWWALFNDSAITCNGVPVRDDDYTHAPKFHDLPYDMQVGIMMRFMREQTNFIPAFNNQQEFKNAFTVCLRTMSIFITAD